MAEEYQRSIAVPGLDHLIHQLLTEGLSIGEIGYITLPMLSDIQEAGVRLLVQEVLGRAGAETGNGIIPLSQLNLHKDNLWGGERVPFYECSKSHPGFLRANVQSILRLDCSEGGRIPNDNL